VIVVWAAGALVASLLASAVTLLPSAPLLGTLPLVILWLATVLLVSFSLAHQLGRPWWDTKPRSGSIWAAASMTIWLILFAVLDLDFASPIEAQVALWWFTAALLTTELVRWTAARLSITRS
jgi:hypothetical protein